MNRLFLHSAIGRVLRSDPETLTSHFYIRYTDSLGEKSIEDFLHLELELSEVDRRDDVNMDRLLNAAENLAERPDHEVVLPHVWPDLNFDLKEDELRQW